MSSVKARDIGTFSTGDTYQGRKITKITRASNGNVTVEQAGGARFVIHASNVEKYRQ